MMADLVSQHVCLREVARSAEASIEFIEEREVDINLLIGRAVKRPGFGASSSAPRLHGLTEKHEFRIRISRPQKPLPRSLRIIQDERYKLNLGFFGSVA